MTALLIPYGLNDAGQITHVDDVPRGLAARLYCPSCAAPLVARKGDVVTHHLAHQSGHPVCEGWLHGTAKHILYQRVTNAIETASRVPVRWNCRCGKSHVVDLLKDQYVDIVNLEFWLADWNIQPDIVCMAGSTPKVIIEIVDSHRPEAPVINSGLPVFEVQVHGVDDFEFLARLVIPVAASHNYPCPDQPCKKCGRREWQGCICRDGPGPTLSIQPSPPQALSVQPRPAMCTYCGKPERRGNCCPRAYVAEQEKKSLTYYAPLLGAVAEVNDGA